MEKMEILIKQFGVRDDIRDEKNKKLSMWKNFTDLSQLTVEKMKFLKTLSVELQPPE